MTQGRKLGEREDVGLMLQVGDQMLSRKKM